MRVQHTQPRNTTVLIQLSGTKLSNFFWINFENAISQLFVPRDSQTKRRKKKQRNSFKASTSLFHKAIVKFNYFCVTKKNWIVLCNPSTWKYTRYNLLENSFTLFVIIFDPFCKKSYGGSEINFHRWTIWCYTVTVTTFSSDS